MNLKQLFNDDITRPIEGVIKADDNEHLLQEVKEYVFTNEVKLKFTRNFIDFYNDYSGVNGVWVSGFFGSGKSHLLKMLSLLLENKNLDGENVLDIFLPKVDDELLVAEINKAVRIPSKSVLFNIDQKADIISKDQEDAVLSVFVKVFNEMQGYYPKLGHVAEFERDLDNEGLYDSFKAEFEKIAGKPWEQRRKRLKMATKEFSKALGKVKGMSEEEAQQKLNQYRQDYKVSIESFANLVKEYIDKQEKGFRLNFFVDEVGQYVSDNTKLMTNLQTIAESLATKCKGQAWVFVTSQEDMDAVLGGLKEKQSNDFSKIQARFGSKINLTSGNVGEVIQKRLLDKGADGADVLFPIYKKEKNNFATLFQFSEGGTAYRGFQDEGDFIVKYPFLPYQFNLFQECIRGLSIQNAFQGKHQSVGERSMLGVFQDVVKEMIKANMTIGHIASFDRMYDGIQATLRGEIQASIKRAEDHADAYHVQVLKALFLVKYVKTFKPTLNHLSILMIDRFDLDLVAHKKKVQEALNRLEYETYIQRNGDQYEYLTNEEKNIENEIKSTKVDGIDVNNFFAKMVYDDVIRDTKIRYQGNKQDYAFTKKMDDVSVSGREQDLALNIITPLHESYSSEDILKAHSMGKAELHMVLAEDERLLEDLRMFKKVEKYFQQNFSNSLKDEIQQIMQRKKMSNNELRTNLLARVEKLISQSTIYLNGQELVVSPSSARNKVAAAFQDLISYAYPNLKMLKKEFKEEDIRTILLSKGDDLFQYTDDSLSEAEREILMIVNRSAKRGERTTIKALLDILGKRPYGWYSTGICCILAKLFIRNKVEIRENADLLDNHRVLANLSNNRKYEQTIVEVLPEVDTKKIKQLKDLHREFFNEANAGKEPKEVGLIFQNKLKDELQEIRQLNRQSGKYPFLKILVPFEDKLEKLSRKNYHHYFDELKEFEDEILDFKENTLDTLKKFMNGNQRKIYDDIALFVDSDHANFSFVKGEELNFLQEIRQHEFPYKGNTMQKAKEHLDGLRVKVKSTIDGEKERAIETLNGLIEKLKGYEEFGKLSTGQQERLLNYFHAAIGNVKSNRFVANIRLEVREFEDVNFHQHVDAMIASATKPTTVISTNGDATKSISSGNKNIVSEPKVEYIPVRKVKVSFKKPYLRTEEEVNEYVEKLREEFLQLIKENKGISL